MGRPSGVKEVGQSLGPSPREMVFMAFKEGWVSPLVGFPVSAVGGRAKLVCLPRQDLLPAWGSGYPSLPCSTTALRFPTFPEKSSQATTFCVYVSI